MGLKLKVHVLGFFGISEPTVTQSQNRRVLIPGANRDDDVVYLDGYLDGWMKRF